ncbi:MAG: hypothetical protein LBC49_04085, partial [Bacteroidales bacterium]|nr:hypothetical protein [Bacteroidales bacterium]
MMKNIAAIFSALTLFGTAAAQPVMPEIFSDEMVLQQNSQAAVWGKSEPHSEITVSCSWLSEKVVTKCNDSGDFIVRIKTLNAVPVKQHTLSIADKTGTVEYDNIVFGEVWLAGGQSNMAFELKKSKNAEKYIDESDNENIRFYYAPHNYYEGYKVKEKGQWVKSSFSTA